MTAISRPIALSVLSLVFGVCALWARGAEMLTLSSLSEYQVVQRNSSDTASLKIQGTISGTATRVEARAVDFLTNTPVSGWKVVDATVGGGNYSGKLKVAAGWYKIEVRGTDGVTSYSTTEVNRVGIGDVFITAGQSNSANHGSPPQPADSDLVASRTAVSSNTWQHADDPQPIATGGGGSPWPQLGDLLVAANGVPVGFVNVGVGGTRIDEWLPGTPNYDALLKPAIESMMAEGGFRAILWHQGESDAQALTTAATYASRLQQIVDQSRIDAGWGVVWGVAEAAYIPFTSENHQEPITAGQRLVAFNDDKVFVGPRTDDFYLEGKLSDLVHFNTAGLNDHAQQWADAITVGTGPTIENPGFEAQTPADGSGNFGRTIGWNSLRASGVEFAFSSAGTFNPAAAYYSNVAASGIEGQNMATLYQGFAGDFMLQTLDERVQPNTMYTLTIALGVRDNALYTFGGYDIDLLADGVPMGDGLLGTLATLNALAGGSASGKFTDVVYQFTTGPDVGEWVDLSIRVARPGSGIRFYLDFDNVRLTAVSIAEPAPVPAPAAMPASLVLLAALAARRRVSPCSRL